MDFLYSILSSVDSDTVGTWAEKFLGHQFTQMTLAFTIANWLNSRKVKQEIKIAFASLVTAIDNVAAKVTNEMTGIKKEIHALTERVDKIEGVKK